MQEQLLRGLDEPTETAIDETAVSAKAESAGRKRQWAHCRPADALDCADTAQWCAKEFGCLQDMLRARIRRAQCLPGSNRDPRSWLRHHRCQRCLHDVALACNAFLVEPRGGAEEREPLVSSAPQTPFHFNPWLKAKGF